ncbi:helix-turn-helix domain-containing protein [Roseovarius marisflavi]|uniref:helix-turn-helix domain-containing protein n=1 Tax=Roseovarius marisflavi TaxID=1054996 RepID=UPI000A037092|nr:helix-turn-helix transcriptional regulator [Roseovarius marisflavi]
MGGCRDGCFDACGGRDGGDRGVNGERIRSARKRAGLTLTQMAERTGLSGAYLSEIETGKKPGSVSALNKIADASGIKLNEIFAGTNFPNDEVELLEAYSSLDGQDKASVLRHSHALAGISQLRRIIK